MKRLFLTLLILTLVGCVSARIPQYLQDKNPYRKSFYTSFDQTYATTKKVLQELDWKIAGASDPDIYEQSLGKPSAPSQQILIFTEIKHTPLFLGTRYAKMNLLLKAQPETTQVEIRYVTVTSIPFKTFESYKNDKAVNKIFQRLEEDLARTSS